MKNTHDEKALHKSAFGDNFAWGVSTSAYQIEGGAFADGKSASIWDEFCKKNKKALNHANAEVSCNFYENYRQDIALLKQMNIKHFRFSISWARILPQGTGKVNQAGIDYYRDVLECCKAHGIQPWVTLYHWDLPQCLQAKGGWCNRDIVQWFLEFVQCCITNFADYIKHWIVLNEPMVFTGAGYFLGVHAPGKKGLKHFLPAVHHTVLCQAQGISLIQQQLPEAQVGTSFSCSLVQANSNSTKDIAAADRIDKLINRLFVEPLLGLGYPSINRVLDRKLKKYILPGDDKLMQAKPHFIGIQNYTREIVRHSMWVPYINAKIVEAKFRAVQTTEMNWEVYPPAIYEMLKQFSAYKGVQSIVITENGAAFPDNIIQGKVHDKLREKFIKQYLAQVQLATNEGMPVNGYFVWSFVDNFEWAEGYKPRFGLVHVDFDTQQRTVKQSGKWYAGFLKDEA
jgi:beta-glucosidase